MDLIPITLSMEVFLPGEAWIGPPEENPLPTTVSGSVSRQEWDPSRWKGQLIGGGVVGWGEIHFCVGVNGDAVLNFTSIDIEVSEETVAINHCVIPICSSASPPPASYTVKE
jgi:hypothetical protein